MEKNRQQIRLTENDLHKIVENTVRRVIAEGETDESLKSMWNGMKQGVSDFRHGFNRASMTTDDNMPSKYNAWNNDEIIDRIQQIRNEEQRLQSQLNQYRSQRIALEKKYGISTDGKGYGAKISRNPMAVHNTDVSNRGALSGGYGQQTRNLNARGAYGA